MPIVDHPFSVITPEISRPTLWVKVTNPTTGTGAIVSALVDTGADACFFPASIAGGLGYKLDIASSSEIMTAAGEAIMYEEVAHLDILEMLPNQLHSEKVLYSVGEIPLHFIEDGERFLLGVAHFLENFVLTIDYPAQTFSIRFPDK